MTLAPDAGALRCRLVAPQARNAITTCFVLTTVLAAADYVTPQLVGGTKGVMIGVAIRDRALSGADLPGAAATTIAFLLALGVVLRMRSHPGSMRSTGRPTAVASSQRLLASRAAGRRTATGFNRCHSRGSRPSSLRATSSSPRSSYWSSRSTRHARWVCRGTASPRSGTPKWCHGQGSARLSRTSLMIAVIGALAATVVGGAMASAATRAGPRTRRLIEAAALLPFVVPGILIGLGLMIAADASPLVPGYAMTVLAHVVLLLPIVMAVILNRLLSLNPEFTQAARDLGARPAVVFRTITLPLILPSLLAAFILCFTISMDEVFVTVFTIGSSTTLPIWILSQARVGFDPGLNALGVMLVTATVVLPIVLYGLWRLTSRAFGRNRSKDLEGAELV